MAVTHTVSHNLDPTRQIVHVSHAILLVIYLAAAALVQVELQRDRVPVYVVGVLAGLVPLTLNQILFLLPGFTLDATVVNRTAVLQWCAYLIPLLGLSVDLARAASDHARERERTYLRRVIDALPDPVYARDSEGRFRLLNNAAAAFLGGSREQLEGRLIGELGLDPDFVARNLEVDREVLGNGVPRLHPPTLVTDAHGVQSWLQMLTQPLAVDGEQADQVLGVATDVSQLKETETALAMRLRGEKTLRRCLARLVRSPAEDFQAAMQDVLRTVGEFCDADAVFVYEIQWPARLAYRREIWNRDQESPTRPSYDLRRLRWALADLVRGNTVMVSDPEILPADPQSRADALSLGARFLVLAPIFSREGKLWGIIGAHCPAPPQPDGTGMRRVLAGLADLYIGALGRVEAETDLQQAKDTAEASASAKGDFLANMSHEIRTPLNAVIGLADILRGLSPTPEQAHYVQMIHQAGDALLGLINDILDFSKIEAGQLQLDPVEVDLPSLLAEVVDMMAYHAQQQGLELVYHLDADARVRATVDGVRLKQVLLNLLNNAIKFTEEGHVALRVSLDADGRCRFLVADTGIGIPSDKLIHVFDKFTQADASHTRKYGGTGLGLAICNSLVTLMGGAIEVVSKPGRGTMFTVTLPLEHRPAEPQAPLPEPDFVGRRHLSIILDPAARECLTGYLADLGVNGLSLGDPLTGVGELLFGGYDFLLVDGQLDSILLETVRHAVIESPPDRRPHMVLVSPLGDEREPSELMAEGWSAVLHKPVRRPTLRRALQAALNPHTVYLGDLEDEARLPDFGAHVLLVEDNPFNQKVATRLLETLGCRVTLAENGQRAVEAAAQERFDLVLMDCQMPVMDGLEAARRIRQLDDPCGQVPVVAMTANVLGEHRQKCLDAGMDDFASKPVNKKTLREIVARWVTEGERERRRELLEV
jgi:PAS domain S-box-containing protein